MDSAKYKENLKKYYNKEAELRNQSVKQEWKIRVRDEFNALLKQEQKKSLLEIGAGAGYDSQYFMNNGLQVVAVDLSREMVKKCKEKGIEAYELDFYSLSSLHKQFDCIWAMNTLLHVPKSDLNQVLHEIDFTLKEDGLFYIGIYGGEDTESEYVKADVSDVPRFFSYHSKDNLKAKLEEHFMIISFDEFEVSRGNGIDVVQSIIMKKSNPARKILHSYYYEGYNRCEISQILRKPQSTIRYYLSEARKMLRKKLGGDFDEE